VLLLGRTMLEMKHVEEEFLKGAWTLAVKRKLLRNVLQSDGNHI
jgi:hypothetical protein